MKKINTAPIVKLPLSTCEIKVKYYDEKEGNVSENAIDIPEAINQIHSGIRIAF